MLSLIKSNNPKPRYVIDVMVKAAFHEVVCIPPYHCELNPIGLCWLQVKEYIKKHNKEFSLTAVKLLSYEGFHARSNMGPAEWNQNIEHVK